MNNAAIQPAARIGITSGAMRAQQNAGIANAQAMGDLRFNQKKLDRRGVSRGRAQATQAGIDGAASSVNALAELYDNQLKNNTYNSQAMLDSDAMREQYGQQLWGLQSSAAYGNAMSALQRQQSMMDFGSGILRGLMG